MTSNALRKKFIDFFVQKRHKEIPSAPLIPPDDPTTLFNGSGMQQLVPYFKGNPHPMGKCLVDSQPCFRAEDIEEVGDNRHTTFFEMLGNWSLGDYFKKEQLFWFFEFLTKVVGLDPEKLYATVFIGNKKIEIPPDNESANILQEIFKKEGINAKVIDQAEKKGLQGGRIFYYDETFGNWWSRAGTPSNMPPGEIGGPCSEMFYDFGKELKLHENSSFKSQPCHVNCDCGRFFEIGNSVFMEYEKQKDGSFKPLPNKNVDFGGGLERILAASQNSPDIFQTGLFWPVIEKLQKISGKKYLDNEVSMRIITDHLKAAVFMAQEGLRPGNKKQNYLMRRLIRRSVVKMMHLDIAIQRDINSVVEEIVNIYGSLYFNNEKLIEISVLIREEIDNFQKTIHKGTKLLQTKNVNGKLLFDLYQTYGFPFEISQELLKEWGKPITEKEKKEFEMEKKKHQELSRTASKGMFKGGLADNSDKTAKLHTATHLLHESLRRVLGNHVQQVGSQITQERLRFDFTHPKKLTEKEIKEIENIVNEQVNKNLSVKFEIMSLEEAQKQGALAFFGQKYPEKVKVYSIGDFSREVCGGPHVGFTGKLSVFKIVKEEAVGSGKRRLYAIL